MTTSLPRYGVVMMMLTKTQQKLIDRAKESRFLRAAVQTGYRTGRKRSGYGGLESRALGGLVRAGLVRIVSQTPHVDSRPRYSDHWTETVYEIVPQPAEGKS